MSDSTFTPDSLAQQVNDNQPAQAAPVITPNGKYTPAEFSALHPILAEAWRKYVKANLKPGDDSDLDLHPIKTRWELGELYDTEFPEPKWAVPGLIPVGLSFLAGRPKLGKSWLALQLAQAVATGGVFLGIRVERGRVLYLALEDSPRRLKQRANKQGIPFDADITFLTQFDNLSEGGLSDLQREITEGKYRLVIIDTFSRAIGKADQLDPADMTTVTGNLQRLAMRCDLAILIIDHHRKAGGFESSPIDDLLGATAKAAVIDCALGLYREQGKHEATLKATGRDFQEQELALAWDIEFCCWQSLGDAGDVKADSLKGEVLQAIRNLTEDGVIPTTTRIAKSVHAKMPNVSKALGDLLQAGKIRKGPKQGKEVPYEVI